MDYRTFPIFKGMSSETEQYLKAMGKYWNSAKTSLSREEIFLRQIYLFACCEEDKRKLPAPEFHKNAQKLMEKLKNPKMSVMLSSLTGAIYGARRAVKNVPPMTELEYYKMVSKWENTRAGLKEADRGNASAWIYKQALNYKTSEDQHRYILNVNPNADLLERLDKFAAKYCCRYKCIDGIHGAYSRPDTIVIYTADKRIDEQKNELIAMTRPYVREKGDETLDGSKIADGLFMGAEKDRAEVEKLVAMANKVYPRMGNYLQSELDNSKSNHPLSMGEFIICDDFIKSMDMFLHPQKDKNRGNEVVIKEGDDKYVIRAGKKPNNYICEKKDKDGKAVVTLAINLKTGKYLGKDYKKGTIFSNELGNNGEKLPELPVTIIDKYKARIGKAIKLSSQKVGGRGGRP